MNHYHLHGGLLAADVVFPELSPAEPGVADWAIELGAGEAPAPDGELLGTDRADLGVEVRAFRTADGYRLRYDDTGVFDVGDRGARICWYPAVGAREELVRADLLGRVLGVALHAGGRFALHGSAVATSSGVIAFVAPKQSGKSTLALALAKHGDDLMADDMVPVDLGPPPLAFPGVQSVRLFRDSARWLGMTALEATLADDRDKGALLEPEVRRRSIVAPLRAVYVLEPAESSAPAVEREPLAPVAAAMALVTHSKVGALLGRSEAPALLRLATMLARSVTVARLRVARDFTRLPHVVEAIHAWHTPQLSSRTSGELAAW